MMRYTNEDLKMIQPNLEKPAIVNAVIAADVSAIKNLIQTGADIHAQEEWALRIAATDGYLEIVELLINAGADISALNFEAVSNAKFSVVNQEKYPEENASQHYLKTLHYLTFKALESATNDEQKKFIISLVAY